MSAIKYADNVQIVRSIVRELRSTSSPNNKISAKDASVEHMLNLVKDNRVTEKRFCRPQDHYKYFAETYLTYLRSTRLQDELTRKYFNKGDKSVEASARLVGLELPKQYQEEKKH